MERGEESDVMWDGWLIGRSEAMAALQQFDHRNGHHSDIDDGPPPLEAVIISSSIVSPVVVKASTSSSSGSPPPVWTCPVSLLLILRLS
jgi:hypothetical protein